jgi:hypothetical protein
MLLLLLLLKEQELAAAHYSFSSPTPLCPPVPHASHLSSRLNQQQHDNWLSTLAHYMTRELMIFGRSDFLVAAILEVILSEYSQARNFRINFVAKWKKSL